MMCEKLLEALVQYRMQQGRSPDILRLNPDYYRMILEQMDYPDWVIKRKLRNLEQTFLGIQVELVHEVKMFEMRRIKKVAES
ncbi:hypothetical protein BK708_01460 [Bacillus thuringiensis serovar yunnanensis]|nr:hypothetical protein BK708_01460 [Bacillus thuringiensis serovar yunnanensis]